MNHQALIKKSETYLQQLFAAKLPGRRVYLFGSRARGDMGRASDFDIWVDGKLSTSLLSELEDEINESFVPFNVNIVSTPDLVGAFGQQVQQDSIRWN